MVRIFNHYIPTRTLILVGIETLILISSIFVGASIRFFDSSQSIPDTWDSLYPKALTFTVMTFTIMGALGLYGSEFREGIRGIMLRLVAAFVLVLGAMSLIFYLLPSLYLGRGLFGIAFIVALVGIAFARLIFFKWTHLNIFKPRILVLGTGSRAVTVGEVAQQSVVGSNLNIIGYLPLQAKRHNVPVNRIISADGSIYAVAKKYDINEIIIAVRDRRGGLPIQELLECKLHGVRITELSSFFERERGQLRLESLNPSWIVLGNGFRQGVLRSVVKRAFDLIASLILLLVTMPVMLITALFILIENGFPIFYRQERVGEGGEVFTIYKFRSMRKDAESDGKPRWARKDDDRTTRVGKIIRKLRIDELPQIFNVLKGEMSFVGPRPERPFFVRELAAQIPYYSARHSVKPGITGWAQVRYPYGASLDDAIEKLQYDLYYVKNHSLFLDIMILIDTIHVVLWGKGAH